MQSSGVVLTLTYCLNIRLTRSLHCSQELQDLPQNKEDAKQNALQMDLSIYNHLAELVKRKL